MGLTRSRKRKRTRIRQYLTPAAMRRYDSFFWSSAAVRLHAGQMTSTRRRT
jgi:hypothetical protein